MRDADPHSIRTMKGTRLIIGEQGSTP